MYELADLPPSLEELRGDYRKTLASFGEHLDRNPFFHAQVAEGMNVFAFHAPALAEYGALEGDDMLTVVVSEVVGDTGTTYTVALHHIGEQLGAESNPPEEHTFMTGFEDDDLEWYDTDVAEKIRALLQAAAENNWFDPEEAWYWVKNRYPGAPRDAYNGQRRGEDRMQRMWRASAALLVKEIETEILG